MSIKKNIHILSFFIFVIQILSCSNNSIIVKSKVDKPIKVYHNGNYYGTANKQDSVVVNIGSTSVSKSKIEAQSDSFYGYIKFGKSTRGKYNTPPKIIVESSKNASYIKHVLNSDNLIDYYYIDFFNIKNKLKTKKVGYIRLTSNESNVDIYVDGKSVGKITNGPLSRKITTGNHRIMAKKEFFMPITIKMKIKSKEIFPYHFELKKVQGWFETQPGQSTVIQARGTLTIVTEKSDYAVYIEGYKKIPPFELKDMPAGEYKLKIECPDFTKYHTVTVKEDEITFFDLDETFNR